VVPVVPIARRRTFPASFKVRIVREADACKNMGETVALLRREGIYSSLLSNWRRDLEAGALGAFAPKARGRKATRDARDVEIERLKADYAALEARLRVAELVCEAQKKVSEILDIVLPKHDVEKTS
jgi:transposase